MYGQDRGFVRTPPRTAYNQPQQYRGEGVEAWLTLCEKKKVLYGAEETSQQLGQSDG